MTPHRISARNALIAASVVTLVGGCQAMGGRQPAAEAPTEISTWVRNYVDALLADPNLSDFEREVFADYIVTDEEYREAESRFAQCMEDRGWLVTFEAGYSTRIVAAPGNSAIPDGPGYNAIFEACQTGTLGQIQPVYLEAKYNPQSLSLTEQIRACFADLNNPLVDGMSDEQLFDFSNAVAEGRERVEPSEGVCIMDPSGIWGVTEDNIAEHYGWTN